MKRPDEEAQDDWQAAVHAFKKKHGGRIMRDKAAMAASSSSSHGDFCNLGGALIADFCFGGIDATQVQFYCAAALKD
eukprot:11297112-Alexandrium_andersonii.AAC.1